MKHIDGFQDVPAGKVAAVVTHLQMFRRLPPRPGPQDESWRLVKTSFTDMEEYRALFRRVGQDWLWFSRLKLTDDELRRIFSDPLYDTYLFKDGVETRGLLELDFRQEGDCEIRFIGLTGEMVGRGAGRWMMNRVLELAWARPIRRLWLHTCTFDHPKAVSFYMRTGFVPYRREVEVVDDPRMAGLLPRDVAPHVPIIEAEEGEAPPGLSF